MAARQFTADYVERVTLKDGTEVTLRLVVPADRELLRAGFERWSPESRYARFLAPKQRLTDEELEYLCCVDQETHFALGALDATNTIGVGIARFIKLAEVPLEPVTADAAIAVADEMQGKGLGRVLFQRLVAAATERGIERFRCDVLGSNASMKGLIDAIAPEHKTEVASGVMSIDFMLPGVPVTADDDTDRDSPMYRFFRGVAQGAEGVRRFLRGSDD